MKNLLIALLLVAVGILTYLHFFKTPNATPAPPASNNSQVIELGKDSLRLTVYYIPEKTASDSTSTKTMQLVYGTTSLGTDPCDPIANPGCDGITGGGSGPRPRPNVIPGPDDLKNITIKQISQIKIERIRAITRK